jgi:membrane fusion protein (multidrug efflux system)
MRRSSFIRGALPLGLPCSVAPSPLRRSRRAAGSVAALTRRRFRRPRRGYAIASGLLAVFALVAATASAQRSTTVDVVRVSGRTLARMRTLPGELLPYESVPLHAKVTGFVSRVNVDRGSLVKRGETLLTIEAPELVAQQAEAEAKLAVVKSQQIEAQAKLAAAESTYNDLKAASATKGAVAENELVQAEKALEAARASIETLDAQARAAKAAADAQQELQSYLRVTAPFDGLVTERNVSPGALVGPQAGANAAPLLKLEDVRRLRLVVAVPEADVSAVVKGTEVTFTVPAFPSRAFHGHIARSAGSIDPKTRTMAVEIDVVNTDGRLAPGMYPEVRWPTHTAGLTLVVPRTAVVVTTERVFVIRVRNGRAEWVDVKRGGADKDSMEVFGDLRPGDEVVARASDEIRNGSAVTPRRAQG